MDVFLNGEWMPEEQATVSAFDRGFLMAMACLKPFVLIKATPFCSDAISATGAWPERAAHRGSLFL